MSERNLKSSQYRVAWLMAAAFLVTLGVGCTKSDDAKKEQPDTIVAEADTVVEATDPGLDDIPGRNPANTLAYLAALDRHWATTPVTLVFDCHEDECAGNRTVHIAAYTHQLTFKIDAARIVDRKVTGTNADTVPGHIVLKLVNLDAYEYEALGLQANDTAYLWVGKTNTKRTLVVRAFAVFRIDQQGNAAGLSRAYQAFHCTGLPDPTHSSVHLVALAKCEKGTTVELYHDPEPSHIMARAGPLHNQGTQYDCPGGCCQPKTFGPY